MDSKTLIAKLKKQASPRIVFSDIDGTLFSPNANIITAPIYNFQTANYLKTNNIPFVLVTGRYDWTQIDIYHLHVLGLPLPDMVIVADGSIIYAKERDHYIRDFTWESAMHATKVTDNAGITVPWNKLLITQKITSYFQNEHISFSIGKGNTFLIRIRFNRLPTQYMEKIRKDIFVLFPAGIHISFTEKLLWYNTKDFFSGEILISPKLAGKESAVRYVLSELSKEINTVIHADVFGDATIDVGMLTMKENPKFYSLSQFGIHPTPLAKEALKKAQKTNSNVHILLGDGPKEILWTLRPELRKDSVNKSTSLSPAQNNAARKVVRIFESFLDRLVDQNLSPNEVSFLGLNKLSLGLALLNKPQGSLMDKTKGFYHYSFGNLTDILDGIRARRGNKREENGQLVDGFSDRAKEFMQLFQRAKKRLKANDTTTLSTFLACISCALPSIARAQVEISGRTVSERDEQGGSMIDRTKRLFLSLLFDNIGIPDQSIVVDLRILSTNLATYRHRLSQAKKFDEKRIDKDMSDFQKKALERFLLYVDVLQQEHMLIKHALSKHPQLLKEYEKESTRLADEYLKLPIMKLRKKWRITDYKLQIKDYI